MHGLITTKEVYFCQMGNESEKKKVVIWYDVNGDFYHHFCQIIMYIVHISILGGIVWGCVAFNGG